jgi:uncharacterized membrane protein
MTLFGSLGSYFFKKATVYLDAINKEFLLNLFVGGGLYLAGAILNIILLKAAPYTIVYPLTSITYIWTMFISRTLLNERISIKKMIGVFLVILGAIFLTF